MVDGCSSSTTPVPSGVPQGSVLGPILFLVYINDLPSCIDCPARLFADDTAIYLSISSPQDAASLQANLSALEEWEANWDMEFNAKKCEVLHVTRKRKPLIYPYTLHGQILESVPTAKYLGVTISNGLRWEPHVRTITKKASRTLGFLRRNLRVSSPRHKEIAYRALVRPQVEYASSVWDPHLQKDIHALEMVQCRAARFVTGRYTAALAASPTC